MVLYLTLFYNAFSDKDNSMSRDNILQKIRELEKELHIDTNDRDHVLGVTHELENKKLFLTQSIVTTRTERDSLFAWKKEKEEEWRIERETLLKKIKELEHELGILKSTTDSSTSDFQASNENLRTKREELLKENKKLEREVEELEKQFNRITKKLVKRRKSKKGA